jgi:hypothetical protein
VNLAFLFLAHPLFQKTLTTPSTDIGSSFDHPVAGELSCNAGYFLLVVFLRFKMACEVWNFHFEISDLIFPHGKMYQPLHKLYNPNNNSHFLLLQDYFPAVANWLK